MDDHQSRHPKRRSTVSTWTYRAEDLRLIVLVFQKSMAALRWQMPQETHLFYDVMQSQFLNPYVNIHTMSKCSLENAFQFLIVNGGCTLCQHKKRLIKDQLYIKIKQVFINKCYIIHSIHQHCWVAKTFQAQQMPKGVKFQTWRIPNGHFYEDQKISSTPDYLSSFPTIMRLVCGSSSPTFEVSIGIPRPLLQRANTQDRNPIKLPSLALMHSSVYQIDFSWQEYDVWKEGIFSS